MGFDWRADPAVAGRCCTGHITSIVNLLEQKLENFRPSMKVFSLFFFHMCLFVGDVICFGFRDNPYLERFRRYKTAISDRDYDNPPSYPQSDFLRKQERYGPSLSKREDPSNYKRLDLKWLKDALGIPNDVYADATSAMKMPDEEFDDVTADEYPAVDDYQIRLYSDESDDVDNLNRDGDDDDDSPHRLPNIDEESQFRYDVWLDSKGDFLLKWDLDPVLEIIRFQLGAKVAKNDVLLFGFSDYGEVTDADVMIMWTNHKGRHLIQVRFELLTNYNS